MNVHTKTPIPTFNITPRYLAFSTNAIYHHQIAFPYSYACSEHQSAGYNFSSHLSRSANFCTMSALSVTPSTTGDGLDTPIFAFQVRQNPVRSLFNNKSFRVDATCSFSLIEYLTRYFSYIAPPQGPLALA